MPRTKVSGKTKRDRENTQDDEKIRLFESFLSGYQTAFEDKHREFVWELENEIKTLRERTDSNILRIKMKDLLNLSFRTKDANGNISIKKVPDTKITNVSTVQSNKGINRNDEGYITEDSIGAAPLKKDSAFTNTSIARMTNHQNSRLRTPGPLNATRRTRRSRSACSGYSTASGSIEDNSISTNMAAFHTNTRSQNNQCDHASRSKMRTPMSARGKALSADRTMKDPFLETIKSASPEVAFMRWPKPGELVLSKCGSPLVAQVLSEKIANVNIPLRNGVISLRPKRLDNVQQHILEAIDSDTLDQLKTLHANLDKIVNMVDKNGLK